MKLGLRFWVLGVVLALGACAAPVDDIGSSSEAIINGELDGDEHPNVGMVSLDVGTLNGGAPFWVRVCSAVYMKRGVALSAAHCYDGAPPFAVIEGLVGITFDPSTPPSADNVVLLTGMTMHPDYEPADENGYFTNDVAVLEMDPEATRDIPRTRMPFPGTLSFLDRFGYLDRPDNLTIVGYGAQTDPPQGPPFAPRQQGEMSIDDIDDQRIYSTTDYAGGGAGPYFGDSGGAVFLTGRRGREYLVGLVSGGEPYGDNAEVGHWHQRLDIPSVWHFVRPFLRRR